MWGWAGKLIVCYWTLPIILDLHSKHGDFPVRYVGWPDGIPVPSVHNMGLVSRLRFPIIAYHGVHHLRSSCIASISPTVVKSSSSLLMYNLGIWTFIGKNGNIETRNPHDLNSKNSKNHIGFWWKLFPRKPIQWDLDLLFHNKTNWMLGGPLLEAYWIFLGCFWSFIWWESLELLYPY